MSWESLKNVLMVVLGAVGSWIVQKGWIDNATMTAVIGAVVTILGALWGFWKGTPVNVVTTAANLPGVTSVKVNDPALVEKTPSNVTQ